MAKTRDSFAHRYGYADFEIIWATAVNDIPLVKSICQTILS